MICDYEHEEQLDGGRFRRVTCQAKAEIGSLCYRHKFQAENKKLRKALDKISKHHPDGNPIFMIDIAKQALKGE